MATTDHREPAPASEACEHGGFHSGAARYDAAAGALRYVVVCDACRRELRELLVEPYAPRYVPPGEAPAIG